MAPSVTLDSYMASLASLGRRKTEIKADDQALRCASGTVTLDPYLASLAKARSAEESELMHYPSG